MGLHVPGSDREQAKGGRMSDSLVDLSCAEFADALAGRQPVPGGGGVAALAGALAVALCSMTGAFTVGRPRYADVEGDVRRMLDECERLRRRLLELVDEDARGFEPLSRAYGLPKDDPSRPAALAEGTKAACAAPLEVMRACARAVELLEEMGDKGSRLLLSDVGCGAALASAALRAAALNVYANTGALADRTCAEELDRACEEILSAYAPRADALAARTADRVKGRG